jgi:hypothetical protein
VEACARAYVTLYQQKGVRIFLNEHASKRGMHPELLTIVRDLRQVLATAGLCRDAVYSADSKNIDLFWRSCLIAQCCSWASGSCETPGHAF